MCNQVKTEVVVIKDQPYHSLFRAATTTPPIFLLSALLSSLLFILLEICLPGCPPKAFVNRQTR